MIKHIVKKLLIGGFIISLSLFPIDDMTIAEDIAEIDLIPNTSRIEKNYDESFLSVNGFAASGVNDRSEYIGTTYYRTASDPREFLQAIAAAQNGDVKAIEITDDMNFGWKELALSPEEEGKYTFIKENADPVSQHTNPLIIEHGISELEISDIDGLTIFSTSGKLINHLEIKIQNTANDIVIRNLSFDGVWQWDDSGDHKEVGWGFIVINGATNVWIDHNTFTIGADGLIDLKNGATNVTLSWNQFGLPADENPDQGSSIYQSIHYMEKQYEAGSLNENSRYYKLRAEGATISEIMAYTAYHSKVHLAGSGDKDFTDYVSPEGELIKDGNHRIRLTLAYNHYLNGASRLPMIRQGTGHLYNNYFDNSSHQDVLNSVEPISKHARYTLARGINSRNGASIAGDTNVYNGFNEPIIGSERQGDDGGPELFLHAMNHFLIVNSKITNTKGETYTGSSWDNNGENLFTKGVEWYDKSTIGKWAWSSSIVGLEDLDKMNPPDEPFTFTYDYEEKLPYEYQIFPLADVESTLIQYAGSNTLDLSAEKWLQINYTSEATSSSSDSTHDDNKVTNDQKVFPIFLTIVGGIAVIAVIVGLWLKRKKTNIDR